MRRMTLAIVVLVLLVAACGDGTAASSSTTTTVTTMATTTTTAPATTTTTAAPATTTTTTVPTTTTTAAPTTTTHPHPNAADALADFFAAAENLDADIKAAAAVFNSEWDGVAGTVGPATHAAVDALDAVPLGLLIPPGLSSNLEVKVLAVFADLDSRIAALDGGARYEGDVQFSLDCLGTGGTSADRFAADLATAKALAAQQAAPTAAPDSEAGGILAVRLTAIHSMNWGCDSCGGVVYTSAMPVDWAAQTVLGVEFDSSFHDGAWDILIYAC